MNLRNPEMRGGDYKSGGSLRAFRRLSFLRLSRDITDKTLRTY